MKRFILSLGVAAIYSLGRTHAATFTVTTADDTGAGSLRAAIDSANTNAGADTIAFQIGSGARTITLASPLPTITDPVTIDATTQPGYSGAPLIEIDGTNAGGSATGLTINAGSSLVRGLAVNGFGQSGITFGTNGNNALEGCYLGLALDGHTLKANFRVNVTVTSANNRIGGTTTAQRNVICGSNIGVYTSGANTAVAGNYIGVSATGGSDLSNAAGVWIESSGNTIGGPTAASRNVILGSSNPSIYVPGNAGGANNIIQNNYIALDATGSVALSAGGISIGTPGNQILNNVFAGGRSLSFGFVTGNGNIVQGNSFGLAADGKTALGNNGGIDIRYADGTLIGGTTAAERNVIVSGITISASKSCTVRGNYIGLTVDGSAAAASTLGAGAGISVDSADNMPSDAVLIGGLTEGARNVISNCSRGITIFNSTNVMVRGNYIGTDATGTKRIPNDTGISIVSAYGAIASNNTIGGTLAGARNVISGNGTGVYISGANSNVFQTNYIGVAADGTTPLPNAGNGIVIDQGNNNLIGGVTATPAPSTAMRTSGPVTPDGVFSTASAGNIISYNGQGFGDSRACGVKVFGGTGNSVLGNSIFGNTNRIGIDLSGNDTPTAVTLNDLGDADTGANNLQNFPVISSIAVTSTQLTINGTLNSAAGTTYRLEFFANRRIDPSGFGQGETYLGSTDVTTDGSGDASFSVTLPITEDPGAITSTATDPDGNTSEFSAAFGARLLNIATRMNVLAGDNVLIAGFIITGTEPKKVIVRGIGPSLASAFGSSVLADPTLELSSVGTNDNWRDTQEAEIEATGLSPGDPNESAIVATLDPGAYTAALRGKDGATGIGLVEVYDLNATAGSRLANISTRGFVDTGDNVMIGGIIVGPDQTGPANVLVRAIGPSLKELGVPNPLQDPTLEIYDPNGTKFAENNDWQETQQAQIEASGIPPSDPHESAYLGSFTPGAYTAIVRGNGGTSGVGLVEAYNVQ